MRKGQSILEYAVLLCVVMSALLIMQVYIKRAYQGRIKQESNVLGEQYSPGHTTTLTVTKNTVNSESYTGGTTDASGLAENAVSVPDGMSVTFSKATTTSSQNEKVESYNTE